MMVLNSDSVLDRKSVIRYPNVGDVCRFSSHTFRHIGNELATVIDVKDVEVGNEIALLGISTPIKILFMLCDNKIYPCTVDMLELS